MSLGLPGRHNSTFLVRASISSAEEKGERLRQMEAGSNKRHTVVKAPMQHQGIWKGPQVLLSSNLIGQYFPRFCELIQGPVNFLFSLADLS